MGWLFAAGLGIGAFLVWFSIITQGAYFGKRMVHWFYDHGASVYDRIKDNSAAAEAAFLGVPICSRLLEHSSRQTMLLDVAVGTGRLPLALLAMPTFQGKIVGVDISRNMLNQAVPKIAPYRDRVTLVNHPSIPLPFTSETFHVVTCIEALEYMPDPHAALHEMVRVLRSGGWLVITNRSGPTAKMMPGRVEKLDRFLASLASLGLVDITTGPRKQYWGIEFYVLIFARKPG